jgi:hypothetical protein
MRKVCPMCMNLGSTTPSTSTTTGAHSRVEQQADHELPARGFVRQQHPQESGATSTNARQVRMPSGIASGSRLKLPCANHPGHAHQQDGSRRRGWASAAAVSRNRGRSLPMAGARIAHLGACPRG